MISFLSPKSFFRCQLTGVATLGSLVGLLAGGCLISWLMGPSWTSRGNRHHPHNQLLWHLRHLWHHPRHRPPHHHSHNNFTPSYTWSSLVSKSYIKHQWHLVFWQTAMVLYSSLCSEKVKWTLKCKISRYRALFGAKNKGDAEWQESVCSEGDYILLLLHGPQQSLLGNLCL